jgi:hypothetical protein
VPGVNEMGKTSFSVYEFGFVFYDEVFCRTNWSIFVFEVYWGIKELKLMSVKLE